MMRLTAPLLTTALLSTAALASPASPTPHSIPHHRHFSPKLHSHNKHPIHVHARHTSLLALFAFTTLLSTIDSPATPLVPSVFTITSPDGILFALTLIPSVSLDWAELHAAVEGCRSRLALEEAGSVASGGGGWYGELKDTQGSIVEGFIITSGAVGALTGGIEYTEGTAGTATADLGVPLITPDPQLATDPQSATESSFRL